MVYHIDYNNLLNEKYIRLIQYQLVTDLGTKVFCKAELLVVTYSPPLLRINNNVIFIVNLLSIIIQVCSSCLFYPALR